MKWNAKWLVPIMVLLTFMVPLKAFADAAPGDVIVTLGEDLTPDQKAKILEEMGVDSNVDSVNVTNEEEHQYLGKYISKAQLGTRAISSSKITLAEKGKGLHVDSKNINWVTDSMIVNALVTAGVKDADIYVTAPFEVSGTAALTGILKAYEQKANVNIPEEKKQVANEEVVRTAQLGDRIGTKEATQLITEIKQELAKHPVNNEDELRDLIKRVAERLGIQLTDEELNGLVSLFNKMKDLNINWDNVQNQLQNVRDNLDGFLNKDETQSFLQKFIDFIISIIDGIKGLFQK
ncbi:DUF1002 domain-containing protein [Fictibacillus sp. WQ 8-8]|uniref:DUF1002 domain-containing protein n=1 Tax=unclassified Fictibacillus TaxID=2644029 RepID=UPI0008EAAACD|nr:MULTISPECIES: DUF1002 domain-containing protein [unclassified Fictibacillus]MCQ6266237.1 DUF1002 domain-containing protein [Fictibacillus sp. WQ 8-8]MED2972543.1 DUF1002 domain-containing protein [Fictibacillus sp. B-59209]SFD68430.1 Uncharacterized protein YpuA, DUF1002 family [Bacillus sp. OV194]